MKECGGDLTMNDMKKLEYIERCLKESMRIQNPVPLIGRKITKDLHLSKFLMLPESNKTEIFILRKFEN